MSKALDSCGSLVVVDEELSTVHCAHSSVKRHILSTPDVADIRDYHVDYSTAEIELGKAVITYLNLDVLSGKLSRLETGGLSQHHVAGIPAGTVSSALPEHDIIKKLAISLLRSRRKPSLDLTTITESSVGLVRGNAIQTRETYAFLPYCQEHWLFHTRNFHHLSSNSPVYILWEALADGRVSTVVLPWCCETQDNRNTQFMSWIVNNNHTALLVSKIKQLCGRWYGTGVRDADLKQLELLLQLPHMNVNTLRIIDSPWQVNSILLDAALFKFEHVAQFALKEGADDLECALLCAVETGNEAMVRLFLKNGAKVNYKAKYDDKISSPLVTAASTGNPSMIQLLLEHGADPNLRVFNPKIKKSTTPLIAVIGCGSKYTSIIIDTLCSAGADVNAFDEIVSPSWRTALEYAIDSGRYMEAKNLFNRGAIIRLTNDGINLLKWAISTNDREFVRNLTIKGVDVRDLDHHGTLLSVGKCKRRFKTTSEIASMLHSAYYKARPLSVIRSTNDSLPNLDFLDIE